MKILYTTFIFSILLLGLNAQVANDNCADAIAIGEVSGEAFSNIGATTDGPLHLNSPCPGSGAPEVDSLYNDIWYLYTPSFTGRAIFSLCDLADFDSKIAVYNPGSSCPPVDEDLLGCNEDGADCQNSTSEMIFEVTMGESYLLRLAGFGTESPGEEGSGTFNVEEFVSSVENDFCADANTVFVGLEQPFQSGGATTDGPEHDSSNPCFQFNDNTIQSDIWFTFTPDFSGPVLWATCDMVTFDTRLGVYGPNADCSKLGPDDLYACNDDGSGCPNYSSSLFFDVEEGNTYLLRLGGFGGAAGLGTFDLINQTPPEPPANDLCENAEAIGNISTSNAVVGTTINAGFNSNTFIFPQCLGNTNGGEFAEVWYSFNNEGFEEIKLDFFQATQDAYFFIDIWESCSSPVDTLIVLNSCTALTEDSGGAISDTLGVLANVPTDYFMRVTTRLTSDLPGDYEFILSPVGVKSSYESPEALTDDVILSPNPVKNAINLEVPLNRISELSYSVQNMLGQNVMSNKIGRVPSGVHNQSIDVSSLSPGIYIINLLVNNKPVGIKFVKE